MSLTQNLLAILNELSPQKAYARHLEQIQKLQGKSPLFCLAVGKTAAFDALAMSRYLKFEDQLLITKYDHDNGQEVLQAGHPFPDENSLLAGVKAIEFVSQLPPDSHLIILLSGGASSLMVAPRDGMSLQKIIQINQSLISKQASIFEINAIRKSLSRIKNGGLLDYFKGASCNCFASNDVPTENLENALKTIGSAPTFFSQPIKEELKAIANKYFASPLLENYLDFLAKQNYPPPQKQAQHFIVNDSRILAPIVKKYWPNSYLIEEPLNCSLERGIQIHLDKMRLTCNKSLISIGEMTVNVTGKGKGGRNTEFVLRMAKFLFDENVLGLKEEQLKLINICSLATDGSDGPTNSAGAIFTFSDYQRALKQDLRIQDYLDNNDSYHFFEKLNCLILTGPTGVNLMDLHLILID